MMSYKMIQIFPPYHVQREFLADELLSPWKVRMQIYKRTINCEDVIAVRNIVSTKQPVYTDPF